MSGTSNYFSKITGADEALLYSLIKFKKVNLISSEYYEEQYQSPAAHQSSDAGLTLGFMSQVDLNQTTTTKEFKTYISGGQGHITDIWLEITAYNRTVGVAGTFSQWWPYLLINQFTLKQGRNYVYQAYNPVYWFMYTISRLPRELRTKVFSLSNTTTITAGAAAPGTAQTTQVLILPLPWSRIWSGGITQPALDADGFQDPGIELWFKFNPINFFCSSLITTMSLSISAQCQTILYLNTDAKGDPVGVSEAFNVPFENVVYQEPITGPTVGSTAGITTFNSNFTSCVLNFLNYFGKGIYLAAQLQTDMTADPPQYFKGAFPSSFAYYPKATPTPAFVIAGVTLQMFQIMQELMLRPWSSVQDVAPGSLWTNNFAWFFGANNDPNDIYALWAFNGTNTGKIAIAGTYPAAVYLTPCAIILQVVSIAMVGNTKVLSVSFGGAGDVGV